METSTKIYVNRTFNCSREELFTWLVEPTLIAKWYGPQHLKIGKVESELGVGKNYSVELIKGDGNRFFIQGKYIEIKKPEKLVFSFGYANTNNSPPPSIVTIKLEEIGKKSSKLSLIQKFEKLPSDIDGRTKVWESMFLKLSDEIKGS